MLEHLRRHVIDLLEPTQVVTLSTCGPAGVQAQVLSSAAQDLRLYILVPTTSEHLYNLEQEPTVVATTTDWQLRGYARELPPAEIPATLTLLRSPQASECKVVEVRPSRLQVGRPNGGGFSETIDFNESPIPTP